MINTFAAAKDIGAAWVRIWLFENGQGLTYNSNNYITGLKADFTTNFNNLLSHAGSNGVKVRFGLLRKLTAVAKTDTQYDMELGVADIFQLCPRHVCDFHVQFFALAKITSPLQSNSSDFPIANFFTDSNAQSALLNNLILPFTRTYGGNGNIAGKEIARISTPTSPQHDASVLGFQLYNELNGIANP